MTWIDLPGNSKRRCALSFASWSLASGGFWAVPFVLPQLRREFSISEASAATLVSVTISTRIVGAFGAGFLAPRIGRKATLAIGVASCGAASLLCALAHSFNGMWMSRAVYGIGLGALWSAGMPYALQDLQGEIRGVTSGVLQAGWNWGYLLAALTDHLVSRRAVHGHEQFRNVLMVGAILLVLLPFFALKDEPVQQASDHSPTILLNELGTLIRAAVVMAFFMAFYYAVTTFYQMHLRERGLEPLLYVVALNAGAIIGELLMGRLSGRFSTATIVTAGVLFAAISSPSFSNLQGARGFAASFFMGLTALGIWGIIPRYLADSFSPSTHVSGPGLSYHLGALIAGMTPVIMGVTLDHGLETSRAIPIWISATGFALILAVWIAALRPTKASGTGKTQ